MLEILTNLGTLLFAIDPNVIMAIDPISLITAGTSLLGGLAGAQGSRSSQTSRRRLGAEGTQERQARELATSSLGQLEGLVGAGAGQQDVGAALASQRGLASSLQRLGQEGLRPEQVDIEAARAQLAPQRIALEQGFQQQQVQAQRLSAQLGRPINDPILQAKLAQQQTQARERFGAQESAQAQQAGLQRIGFQQALSDVRGGLASQALQNRQTLLQLGSQVQERGRAFRLQSAPTTTSQQAGGGFGGFLTGAIGGAGAGLDIGAGIGRLGGFGGGGGGAAPSFSPTSQLLGSIGGAAQAPSPSTGGGFTSLVGASAPGFSRFGR